MIASEDPWVRAPVVSPGAWKRSASIRMQRCSISAVRGYSAWSMKLRCRLAAMILCASGSIQVVTKVARFLRRVAVEHQLLPDQAHGVDGGHARVGQPVVGNVLADELVAEPALELVEPVVWCLHLVSFLVTGNDHRTSTGGASPESG